MPTSRTGSGGSSRSTPAAPNSTPRQAHRDGALQARGRQRHRRTVTARRRVHGRRRALRLPLQVRLRREVPHGRPRRAAGHNRLAASRRATCPSRGSPATASTDGSSDGTGEWLPLVADGQLEVPGFSLDEVLVYTRLAADAVSATKMDRREDVEPTRPTARSTSPAPTTPTAAAGKEGATEANPRNFNKDGHVVEITERRGDHTAATFGWNLLLVCGDPANAAPTSPATRPGLADLVPRQRRLRHRRQPVDLHRRPAEPIGHAMASSRCRVDGAERGRVQQFLAVPAGAETCGPVIHDRDGSVFVAVQHPGEDGTCRCPGLAFPRLRPGG